MTRPRITGRWTRPPEWRSPVWERPSDGARIHTGGHVRTPAGSYWPTNNHPDSQHPLWLRACALEPESRRRALMLFADLLLEAPALTPNPSEPR